MSEQDKKEFIYIFDPKEDLTLELIGRLLKSLLFQSRVAYPQATYDKFPEEDKKHFKAIQKKDKSRIITAGVKLC